VKVEPEVGLEPVVQSLQRPPLGRREAPRIAIHVHAERVLPLEEFGAVGVEHRDQRQRDGVQQAVAHRIRVGGAEPGQYVDQRHRRRGLVAVHLAPGEDLHRPAPGVDGDDRAPLHRAPDLLETESRRVEDRA
jgi:hypothetical protein